ncbi:MAG TPA: flagellar basal-body MS-ring/collar protein FliF [Bryobacteraceae bacterium]|nr:flagellar basal-body MS-ring/collar protein FliF [Bryobacteraceae bacterium]
MAQLIRIWNSLSLAQRVSLVIAPLLVVAIAAGVIRWRHDAAFRILYSSLAPEDAAAVTQKIREAGIEYRLDETGSTVSVPEDRLAEARLALAGAGMPRSGRIGFELFDRTNPAASDFTEQVNYQRALEGELERTVSTLDEVAQARIHITVGKDSVFLDSREPAKATVVLRLKQPMRIRASSVTAIANLVASAVEGLAPDAVSIIDDSGRLLNRPHAGDGDARNAEVNLDYQQQLETELQAKLNAALEPLLGAGRFRAGVNIDCDFTSMDQSDEIYDSTQAATLSTQTTEESNNAALAGGTPGTASNLPAPPPKATGGTSGVTRRTENVSYQPSRTVRHTVSPKGTIRKISTVVLVDHTARWEGAGAKAKRVVTPPSPEVLKAVREVVAGVVAYNEQRGDQITVESLPFETPVDIGPPPAAPSQQQTKPGLKQQQWIVFGAAGFVVLLAIGGALFLMRKNRTLATDTSAAVAAAAALPAADVPARPALDEANMDPAQIEAEVLNRLKIPAPSRATEVLIRHVREKSGKDPAIAANVLKAWIAEGRGKVI